MADINLIVAYADNQVIGKDNQLIWHLPSDLKHFKNTTLGCPIIMGRKTWESIGRPLPGRLNIVISRNANYALEGAQLVSNLDDAIKLAQSQTDKKSIFIIGGEQIYRQSLAYANYIYATEVHLKPEGDAFFPALESTQWQELERQAQHENQTDFDFVLYKKLNN